MGMLRTPTTVSPNRSLAVLVVLLALTVAGIAAARELAGASFGPVAPLSAPVYVPSEIPVPLAPAVDTSPAPMPTTEMKPGVQTGASPLPAVQTALPVPASVGPVAPRAAPVATAVPHPTVPVGPATTAAPGRDIPAIAPELGLPGFTPPPGRE